MTCRAVGVPVNMKMVNTMEGEESKDSFRKINPMQTLPTMDDDGFYLCESRTIMRYIVNKYGKSDDLYPTDAGRRAKVDMMLDYDLGTLSSAVINWVKPQAFCGQKPSTEQTEVFEKTLNQLETIFLANSNYLTGEQQSIADFSAVASVTYLEMVDFDFKSYPAILAWVGRLKKLSFFHECNKGLYEFIDMKKAGQI